MEFSVLSYNLDSTDFNVEERLQKFVSKIQEIQPDVLLVQEVRQLILEKLSREMKSLGYSRYIPNEMISKQTKEMVFSKIKILETKCLPLFNGTTFLTAVLIEPDVWVVTSQLEGFVPQRRRQLSLLDKEFKKDNKVVFGGDTRITNYQQELSLPEVKPGTWKDTWNEAGTSDSFFTYTYIENANVESPFHDRPDQIWWKGDPALLCVDHLLVKCPEVSSHFGVLAYFQNNFRG